MFLLAAYSACGATHKRNDDRAFANSIVLSGAEEPNTSAEYSETAFCSATEIETDAKWKSNAQSIAVDNPIIATVFDGVGGSAHGNQAALAGATCLLEEKNVAFPLTSRLEKCADSIREIQAKFKDEEHGYSVAAGFQLANFKHKKSPIPTNMSDSHLQESLLPFTSATPFNAGDSRTYFFRNNELSCLTKDHTLANYRRSLGIEPLSTAEENIVTQFLGGDIPKPFAIYESFKVEDFDIIFSASDGFWGYISEETFISELSALIKKERQLLVEIKQSEANLKKNVPSSNEPHNSPRQVAGNKKFDDDLISSKKLSCQADTYGSPIPVVKPAKKSNNFGKVLTEFDDETGKDCLLACVKSFAQKAKENGSPDDITAVFAICIPN